MNRITQSVGAQFVRAHVLEVHTPESDETDGWVGVFDHGNDGDHDDVEADYLATEFVPLTPQLRAGLEALGLKVVRGS